MTRTLTGKLMYTGDGYQDVGEPFTPRPWPLVQTDNTEIDLREPIMEILRSMDGKPAIHRQEIDTYDLWVDKDSRQTLSYNEGHPVIGNKDSGSSVRAYLEGSLGWLTGRQVRVLLDEYRFFIEPDRSEEVYLVPNIAGLHQIPITQEVALNICKVTADARCIFSGGDFENGFTCGKFENLSRNILNAHATGRMRAAWVRIGNCGLAARQGKTTI